MSEYQYYEFLSLDCPLSKQQQEEELRMISSRARINATSFVNFYNFGDLHAEPDDLIAQYFDVFSYFSSGSNWILNWSIPENDNYERFALEDGEGWMTRLLGLREELINGDFRSLYLAWLCAATYGLLTNRSKEPMIVAGLAQLTAPQVALAEFIEIDIDLIRGAATGSADNKQEVPEEVDDWISQLSKEESTYFIKSFFNDPVKIEQVKLKQAYHQWFDDKNGKKQATRRTLKEIKINRKNAMNKRIQQEKIDQEKKHKQERVEREKYINDIYSRANLTWKTVAFHIEKGTARGYKDAVDLLCNLKEAYQQNKVVEKYQKKLNLLIEAHQKRRALMKRIKDSKLQ